MLLVGVITTSKRTESLSWSRAAKPRESTGAHLTRGARRTARMSFAHRSVLKEMREKRRRRPRRSSEPFQGGDPGRRAAPNPRRGRRKGKGITRGVPQVPEDNRWRLGEYAVRADFDGGNLRRVEQTGADGAFQLWTRSDCEGATTPRSTERGFTFASKATRRGDAVVHGDELRQAGEDFPARLQARVPSAPVRRQVRAMQPVGEPLEDGPRPVRWTFRHKVETAEPTYFAFTFPSSRTATVSPRWTPSTPGSRPTRRFASVYVRRRPSRDRSRAGTWTRSR